MESITELTTNELAMVSGGDWRDSVNHAIDYANDWLADNHVPIYIKHI